MYIFLLTYVHIAIDASIQYTKEDFQRVRTEEHAPDVRTKEHLPGVRHESLPSLLCFRAMTRGENLEDVL